MRAAFGAMAFLFAFILGALAEDGRGAVSLSPDRAERPFTASRALVIGVDDYDSGWRKLTKAVADAKAVAEALKSGGFDDVELVTDPDGATMAAAIKRFIYGKGADPDARLLIWFAGHGHTIGGEGYLAPRDAPMPDGTPAGEAAFQERAVAMSDFARYMNEVKARHVLAIFDSCFSGSVFDNNRVSVPVSTAVNRARLARQYIAAGGARETAADDGAFRQAFIDALQGRAKAALGEGGHLTGASLGQHLARTISNATGGRQNPIYATSNVVGLDRGDFVFPVTFDGATVVEASPVSIADAPVPSDPRAPIEVFVDTMTAAPGDDRAAALAGRLERGLVEYYVTNKAYVSSNMTGRKAERRPDRSVRGDVRIFGDEVEIVAVMTDADGRTVATADLQVPAEFILKNHKVLAPTVHYLFEVSLRTFEPLHSANRPTADGHAWALYLAARRRAEAADMDGAEAFLREAIDVDPRFAGAYGALADVAERQGDDPAAVAAIRMRATAIDRDHARLNILGDINMGDPAPALLADGASAGWAKIADGVEERRIDADEYGVSIIAWRVDESRAALALAPAATAKGETAREIRERAGAILAINGGFFDLDIRERLTPAGLFVSGGRTYSGFDAGKAKNPLTGILYRRGGRIGVMWARDYREGDAFDFAVQTGPLVVDPGGVNGIYSNSFDRQNRSAVCIDFSGRPIVVAVAGGLSLFEFGQFLSQSEADGGMGCERAINLDGGPSTQVSVGVRGAELELPGLWKVASGLLVTAR